MGFTSAGYTARRFVTSWKQSGQPVDEGRVLAPLVMHLPIDCGAKGCPTGLPDLLDAPKVRTSSRHTPMKYFVVSSQTATVLPFRRYHSGVDRGGGRILGKHFAASAAG